MVAVVGKDDEFKATNGGIFPLPLDGSPIFTLSFVQL
jgi:hypothetical protein